MSSNDFNGPYGSAGGRGADDYSGSTRGADAGGSGAQGGTGRHSANRNGDGNRGNSRANANGNGAGAGSYPEPEGWGDDGFWRDSSLDSEYETGLNSAVRTNGNGPKGSGGYSYWADGKGWENSPGDVAGGGPGNATRADYVAGMGATASYGQGGDPAGGYGPGGDPTAVYGSGGPPTSVYGPGGYGPGGPGGWGPGGPGRGGPGRGGRGRGPGGPGRRKGSWWRHWTWKKALGIVGAAFMVVILLMVGAYYYEYGHTTIPTQELVANTYQNSTVYYSDGKTPIGTFAIVNRHILTWDQIPTKVDNAVMAAEDRSFMTEGGVSPTGIMRAAWDDLTGSGTSLSGGSTITQEFVRQYYAGIGTQQTLTRKIKEAFVAMKISKEKSKEWILTNYLNTIYLGDNSYGVAAAAQTYFGVPVSKLTVAQAAVIAAIIQQPTTFPQPQYRSQLTARWHYVLDGMVKMGNLTQAQADSMQFPKLLTDTATQQQFGSANGNDPWAPYIMNTVANELEGVEKLSQAQLETGGYKIVTTISRPMEVEIYKAVNENIKLIKQQGNTLPWYALIGAELQNPSNGAIVAMYPGRGQNMSKTQCQRYDCNDNTAVYTREQVGSSFKPYVLATAVNEGMNVQTSILNASPHLWVPPDSDPLVLSATSAAKALPGSFPVENDQGETIPGAGPGGATSVTNALAQSSNTAYTDLAHRAGTQNIINMAQNMGVNTGDYPNGSGLQSKHGEVGIALGTGSLTVNEQATMLSTIDDNGLYHSAHIVDWYQAPGAPVHHGIVTSHIVLSPALDSQVQSAMEKTTVDGTGTAAAMSDGRPILGKTGTTTSSHSAFFIGAIPQYSLVVGIFTQNQDNKDTTQTLTALGGGGFGGTWPAAIWHTFAQDEFLQLPVMQFQSPIFTGAKWNQVGKLPTKKKPTRHPQCRIPIGCPTQQPPGGHHGHGQGGSPSPTPSFTLPFGPPTTPPVSPTATATGTSSATPSPTATATKGNGGGGLGLAVTASGVQTGLALGGVLSVLPGSLLWASASRRRRRRRSGTAR